MSLEDAAAIQQDLAGGGAVVAAQQTQEEETTQLQDDSALQISDDPRDAPTMSMLADLAGANENGEQRQLNEESAVAAAAQVEAQTTEEQPIVFATTQDGHIEGAQAEAQAHTTTAEEEVQPLALATSSTDTTNASLDALLGSLANANDQSASIDQSIDELASASLSGVSNVEAMDESVSAVQTTEQEQEASAAGISSAAQETATNNDEVMTEEAHVQDPERSLPSESAQSANQPTDWSSFVAPDASGPVPGLPNHIAIDTSSTSQDATMDNQAALPQISQIRQEATPAGTPTLLPASLPSSQQQSQAQPDSISAKITAPSSSSSTPILKITQLATDPNLAYSTAQQLLSSRPQTLSRLQKLRKRVEVNKFDGEAWLEIINDALQKGDLDRTREVYDQFLQNFPDNVRHFSSSSLLWRPFDVGSCGWLTGNASNTALHDAAPSTTLDRQPGLCIEPFSDVALCFCFPVFLDIIIKNDPSFATLSLQNPFTHPSAHSNLALLPIARIPRCFYACQPSLGSRMDCVCRP